MPVTLPPSIKAYKGSQKSLQIAPLDMLVSLCRADSNPILGSSIEGANGYPAIPPAYRGVGYIAKDSGINVSFDMSANNIESAGEGLPTRIIIDKQSVSADFEMRQIGRQNLELMFSADYSGVVPTANGGIHAPIATVPENQEYRAILMGQDNYNGLPIFFGYVLNRTQTSKLDNQKWSQKDTLLWHPTITTIVDDMDLDHLGEFFIFGPGFQALQGVADTGFTAPVLSWINITPPSSALSVSLAGVNTVQLHVTDNNGVDRTAAATYTSGTQANATVNSTGLVTGVATGSSVITAAYGGKTATTSVTVTA
ncbi:Ig-like domain-containing protein [Mycobacteroides abscessus]|nr:Ig-like domain-containing protein [Mycobacteroides abscessus]MDM2133342.1 Ig-like domain-containing protein [Mycobacteroides abscessus]MDM2145033.1 Ig-like domain-containing protein [Mycobacteroides abscessus]MDM2153196.1 Ig-like domain-containing protein [Mycobacteroides abscessus]MDM2182229.1 Ig-like domain-containing protein [Mycobacteroides abscessus]